MGEVELNYGGGGRLLRHLLVVHVDFRLSHPYQAAEGWGRVRDENHMFGYTAKTWYHFKGEENNKTTVRRTGRVIMDCECAQQLM